MLAKVSNSAVVGLDGAMVDVEVDIANGMPIFTNLVLQSHRRGRGSIAN